MASDTSSAATAAARVRLNRALTKHLAADFSKNGAQAIAALRVERPSEYLRLITTALSQNDEAVLLDTREPSLPRLSDKNSRWESVARKIRRNLQNLPCRRNRRIAATEPSFSEAKRIGASDDRS